MEDGDQGSPGVEALKRRYLARAADRVEELRPDEPRFGNADPSALEDRVQQALEDDAVHELREIVSQIRGGLEIALGNAGPGDAAVPIPRERAEGFMEALDRAEAVLDTHLDRSKILQLLFRLETERFDVAKHLAHFLTSRGLDETSGDLRTDLESTLIEADREKVVLGLGHAGLHLFQRAPQGSTLYAEVAAAEDGGARGRLTISPAPFDRETLIKELDRPFRLETVEIGLPYTRAVLERHGGGVQVATGPDGGLGYAFHLPSSPPEVLR